MDYVMNYIKAELVILIPVMYLIGIGLKKSKVPDNWIPAILGLVSITLSAAWIISTSDIQSIKNIGYAFFMAITQGILIAGTSVYINQLYVQSKKK